MGELFTITQLNENIEAAFTKLENMGKSALAAVRNIQDKYYMARASPSARHEERRQFVHNINEDLNRIMDELTEDKAQLRNSYIDASCYPAEFYNQTSEESWKAQIICDLNRAVEHHQRNVDALVVHCDEYNNI